MPSDSSSNPSSTPGFPHSSGAIRSSLSSDPDMVELIAMFVEELPQRTEGLRELLERRELAQVQRIAHQLKGAAGGYGFADLGHSAALLEGILLDVSPAPADEELNRVRERVDELIELCRRATVA